MRAIILMCLAWSIVIVATPGLADRYVSNSRAVSATAALPADGKSDANPADSSSADASRAARIERISDLRTDCRRDVARVDIADSAAYAARPMPAVFDVPDSRGSIAAQGANGLREASSAGLCR